MKKYFLICSTACFIFIAGCEVSAETTADKGEYIVNIAYGNQPDEPIGLQAQKWKELAEEKSNGQLQLNLYPSSQLGDEGDMIELAINGNNVVVFTAYDFLMDYVSDFGIMNAPYIADSEEDLFYLTQTDWFGGLEQDLKDEVGLEIVATNTLYGDRHLMTQTPVNTPDDLAGMRIRVPDNNLFIRSFSTLGASPTPLPLGDLYASLQQGVIDGAENPLPVLAGSRTHEVTNYLNLTGHMTVINPWVTGEGLIEEMPEDLRAIFMETAEEAGNYGQEKTKEAEKETIKMFEEEGVIMNEVDQDLFKKEAEELYESMPGWSEGLHEEIQNILDNR